MMTSAPLHPRDSEAAEYVLGTLSQHDRRAAERDMATDPGFAQAVLAWEERLSPIAECLAPVRPSDSVWPALGKLIEASEHRPVIDGVAFARLRRSRSLWRTAALGAAALAASLAIYVSLPLLVPAKPSLMAVVNRSGDLPALIVRVDLSTGTIQVRSVHTEIPEGKSLELWSIAHGDRPRSLGVIAGRTELRLLPAGERERLSNAVLAVSVEPPGGSTTGQPTGPVVYQGKLIPEN